MGEVWRARDPRLGREIAIKISVQQFTDRFEREARAIASLNHPNVCTLFDVGPNYLVMELIEGPTLADRIQHGALPLDESLGIAKQIADALEAAHEKGIVHRDLKPANIKIRPDGSVKVLDFGLAKSAEQAELTADSPTMMSAMSIPGMIMGTAGYMSPEQARGQTVDKRADIWSFGVVLYEMVTGRRLFDGSTVSDSLAAILKEEPDWTTLPATTPAPLRRLLNRCLQKDRKRRLPDIGVARLEIEDALAAPEQPAVTPKRRGVMRKLSPWIAAWIVAGAVAAGPAKAFQPRLSPDGQMLSFLAFVDQLPQLGVMKPNRGSWTMLTHDREHGYVTTAAWAPDGSRIYFDRFAGRPLGIYSIPPLGGEPRLLLDDAFGPEPLPDGSLIVEKPTDRGDQQLFRYWPESGKLDALPAFLPARDVAPMLRAFPDGKELVYLGTSGKERTQSPRLLIFDLASGQTRELTPGISIHPDGPWAPLDVAPDGKSVYFMEQEEDTSQLVEAPRKAGGRLRALLSFPLPAKPIAMNAASGGAIYLDLRLSPSEILRLNPPGGAAESFEDRNGNPEVVPGGDVLVALPASGRQHLAIQHPGSEPRDLVDTPENTAAPATTFGGNVAFVIGVGDQRRIAIASMRDGRVLRRYSTRSDNGMAASPDGKILYYSYSGAVWAQPVDGGDPKRITAGVDVTLDPEGRFLYVKRTTKGTLGVVRIPVSGGDAMDLPVPAEYHVSDTALSPASVDARGRILVTVISNHSFYYQTAILDPAAKSFTLVPMPIDGDAAFAGWTPDGRILAGGVQYLMSLWRYRRSGNPR